MKKYISGLIVLIVLTGCVPPPTRNDIDVKDVTVGVVQKEIKIGMSGSEVLSALGSPNMVSTDSKRREVWVYDKISSSSVSNSSSGGFFLLIANAGSNSSERETSQKTLTIIINYDDQGLVRDYQYHSSRF
jgi:outer membrane protein assembly factor BamE (lipoprotein component of BamABCDE complex)